MPNVFGTEVVKASDIVDSFRKHGDAIRCTYRARYVLDRGATDAYAGARLERPEPLRGNPADRIFPWEQIFIAAANCAGSDYPMLAEHWGVPLERVEFVVEGAFDPRGEFDGLDGYEAPSDAGPAYLSLHLTATLTSSAPSEILERIHQRVMARNMVLGALRGIPRTHRLTVNAVRETAAVNRLDG